METMPKPSFYKILMDIPPELGVPQGFMEKYGEILPRKAELRNASGATWEVKVEKLRAEDEDHYFFTKGWTKFAQDMGLQILELLIFSYAGNSTFDVSVYATTALEKVSDAGAAENPQCLITLKEYDYYRCRVRADFSLACDLRGKKEVTLEYVGGGESAQVVLHKATDGRVAFGAGWSGFRKANEMTLNKTYSFEFVRTRNVIRVQPHQH